MTFYEWRLLQSRCQVLLSLFSFLIFTTAGHVLGSLQCMWFVPATILAVCFTIFEPWILVHLMFLPKEPPFIVRHVLQKLVLQVSSSKI